MRNVSGAFRQKLKEEQRQYVNKAIITLADETELTIENEHIMIGGMGMDDAVSDDNKFTALGAVVIGSAKLVLYNLDELYSDYTFVDAKVLLYTGLEVPFGSSTIIEELKLGEYIVDRATYGPATITLELLDNLSKFDRPYSLSNKLYPATLGEIVQDCCDDCGVTLGTPTFPHYNFPISARPVDDAITYRNVISWCATIAGCFARCDSNGKLELKWFNKAINDYKKEDYFYGGVFDEDNPYSTGDDAFGGLFDPWDIGDGDAACGGSFIQVPYIQYLYSQNIAVDFAVITGVKVRVPTKNLEDSSEIATYLEGTDDYVILIEDNKFINEDNIETILSWLGPQMIGFRFRPSTVRQIDDPSIEAGDVGLLKDTFNGDYPILITRTTFNPGSPQTIVSGGESPARNSSTRFTQTTQAYAESHKLYKQQRSSYEQDIAELRQKVNNAGGLYTSAIEQPDHSVIRYFHSKPLLSESDIRIVISDVGITVTANGTDAQPTWYGLTVDGNFLASILSANGINANWINTGIISVEDTQGNETFYANVDTGVVRINADSFSWNNTYSTMTDTGILTCINGNIGGWTIDSTSIYKTSEPISAEGGHYQYQARLYAPATPAWDDVAFSTRRRNVSGSSYGDWVNRFYVTYGGVINGFQANLELSLNVTNSAAANIKVGGSSNYAQLWCDALRMYKSGSQVASIDNDGFIGGLSGSISSFASQKIYIKNPNSNYSGRRSYITNDYTYGGFNFGGEYYNGTYSYIYTYPYDHTYFGTTAKWFNIECGQTAIYFEVGGTRGAEVSANGIGTSYDFTCRGTKNRCVETDSYNDRLLYCYETPAPYFGDIGESITDETGVAVVQIDDIFTESARIDVEYQVFLQAEGEGSLYVDEKESAYFIVKGTPNLKFAWEMKAVQRDYESYRFETPVKPEDKISSSIDSDFYIREMDELRQEQEDLIDELLLAS